MTTKRLTPQATHPKFAMRELARQAVDVLEPDLITVRDNFHSITATLLRGAADYSRVFTQNDIKLVGNLRGGDFLGTRLQPEDHEYILGVRDLCDRVIRHILPEGRKLEDLPRQRCEDVKIFHRFIVGVDQLYHHATPVAKPAPKARTAEDFVAGLLNQNTGGLTP